MNEESELVKLTHGGIEKHVDLEEFFRDNPDIDRTVIEKALEESGIYEDGGGASPGWSLEVVTTAERIADTFDDGTRFTDDDGRELSDVCLEAGASVQYAERTPAWETGTGEPGDYRRVSASEHTANGLQRYLFEDGSAIVMAEMSWDVEGSEPFSWRGAE